MKVMFSKMERFLIRKNKRFVIYSDESDSKKFLSNLQQARIEENDITGEKFHDLFADTGLSIAQESDTPRYRQNANQLIPTETSIDREFIPNAQDKTIRIDQTTEPNSE